MTANAPTMAGDSAGPDSNLARPPYPLHTFLLGYRWASLLLATGLFTATTNVAWPEVSPATLLSISIGSTLLITVLYLFRGSILLDTPLFLAIDLLFAAILLTLSGLTDSPYQLYALSPLLAGALFFQIRGAVLAAAFFSLIYALAVFNTQGAQPIEVGQLFSQLAGVWLAPLLFGGVSKLLNRLQQAHKSLVAAQADLARQHDELAQTHHQLEIIHDLTLFLHASDKQSSQQRLLRAVTRELGFSRAVLGLVNPTLQRLEDWFSQPALTQPPSMVAPLPLKAEENSPLIKAALQQQVTWCAAQQELTTDKMLEAWLGPGNWLILPLIWQEQTVGVLLVAVETIAPADVSDDRWAVLTSLVSQAAVALGTIDRTQRLAVEQERNRIARDIHDTVAQSLFGIAFTLDACIKLLPQQAEAVKQELVELQKLAEQVRREVRQSILDLWPSELTQAQFQMDLRKYVGQCAPTQTFDVDFKIDGDFDGLPAVIRRSLYRVCQEALANTAQHAHIDNARVYLYVEPTEVHLSIRDKGQGFDPKSVLRRERDRERFGLKGMQERIQALGGTCDILSQAGYGTQVLVRVPINGKNDHG